MLLPRPLKFTPKAAFQEGTKYFSSQSEASHVDWYRFAKKPFAATSRFDPDYLDSTTRLLKLSMKNVWFFPVLRLLVYSTEQVTHWYYLSTLSSTNQ